MPKDQSRGDRERAEREYARIRSLYADQKVPERLQTLVCTVCGRKRNVPESVPAEEFVCSACKPATQPAEPPHA